MSKRKADDSILSSTKDIDITSLPDGVLSHISGYVQHSFRPLLAVAMTAPPSSFRIHNCNVLPQSTMRDAILFPRNRNEEEKEWDEDREMDRSLSESQMNWSKIDFKRMNKIDGGLTDDILHAALVCIGVSRIKSLEFTRCSKLTGWGLYPLWKSKVLERIDLSGIKAKGSKWRRRTIFTAIKSPREMLIEAVIPVLESIVDETDNSLWHVQFPKHFRVEGGNESFHQFLSKFNENIRGKVQCGRKDCNNLCGGMHMSGDRYGIQSGSCSFDHSFENNENANFCGCAKQDEYDATLEFCHKCMKYYCTWCNEGYLPLTCECGKPHGCGSCSDSAYCDTHGCSEGPLCSDCYLECKCGQRYCRMEEARESVCNISLVSSSSSFTTQLSMASPQSGLRVW